MNPAVAAALTVLGACVVFAIFVALLSNSGRQVGWSTKAVGIAWLPLVTLGYYLLFLELDRRAGLVHARNVGIPVIAVFFWFLTLLPGSIAGILIVRAWQWAKGARS